MYNLKSEELNLDNYFTKKNCGRASVLTFTLGILSGFGTSSASNQRVRKELSALTGRKKPVLDKKKGAKSFIDLYHNFEQQKIEFKSFDQQSDVSMRGL